MSPENKTSSFPKIAAIQMCSSDNVDENLKQAAKYVREAAHNGAKLIVLPENFSFMGLKSEDRLAHKEQLGQGKTQELLSRLAKENRIWLVGGTIPIVSDHERKVRASCLVYDDQGSLVARYDKIHMFDAVVSEHEEHKESNVVEPGSKITVLDTPVGKLGLAVCFDVRFPAMFTQFLAQGVEIVALPSAFTVPTGKAHWEILNRCRAIDTFAYLISAAQGGTHTSGRKTYGHSLIIDPWGMILAEKNDEAPGVIYAEVDLKRVYQSRAAIPTL